MGALLERGFAVVLICALIGLSSPFTAAPPLTFLSFDLPRPADGEVGPPPSSHSPPIILLHGLLGQAKNFQGLGTLLAKATRRKVYALDLSNHGNNGRERFRSSMGYSEQAADVNDWMEWMGIDRAVVVGHSMGGKVAMALACSKYQHRLDGLVVIDIAPVRYAKGDGTMWETIQGVVDACWNVKLDSVKSKKEVDRLLGESGIADVNLRSFILTNLEKCGDADEYRWKVNLEAIRSNLDSIAGFDIDSSPGDSATYPGDTFFIAGGNSKYVKINHLPEISKMFPSMMVRKVRGCGHWVHGE